MSLPETEYSANAALQRYYPCVVIAIAFITVGTAFGARNAFAVFLVAVVEELRWSRGLASGALMFGAVMWTLAAPFIGMLLDRYGPRIVLAGGSLVMAAGFVVSGLAHSVTQFYLGMGLLVGIGFAALPMTSQATFLSNWFVRRRGVAIGIAASGIGFGIFVMVPLTQRLISSFGWRAAYFVLAALLVLLIAPLNFFFQRQRPEEMGLRPDFGEAPPAAKQGAFRSAASGLSLKQALRTARFWYLALGVLSGAIPLHLVLIHQVAAVNDSGFSKDVSAFALALIGLFTAPSMIAMGMLADRIGRQLAYAVGSLSLMAGTLLLMVVADPGRKWLVNIFPLFIAFGFSSRQSLYPTIAADLFHGKSFGSIIGAIALFIGAGAGIGPWLGGVIYDWTGSYHDAFTLAVLLSAVSVGFIWMAGRKIEPAAAALERDRQSRTP
jgi:MFS family permease